MTSVLCLTLFACTTTPSTAPYEAGSSSSRVMVPSSIRLEQSSTSSEDGVILMISSSSKEMMRSSSASSRQYVAPSSKAAAVHTVMVDVSNFAFTPSVIKIKKGEKTRLQLVGASGIHGFSVPGLGINVRIEAGKTVMVDVPTTDNAGTFDVFCSIPCGPGHRDMKAAVVIQ